MTLPQTIIDAVDRFGDQCAGQLQTGARLVERRKLLDAIAAAIGSDQPGGQAIMVLNAAIRALLAERDALRIERDRLLRACRTALMWSDPEWVGYEDVLAAVEVSAKATKAMRFERATVLRDILFAGNPEALVRE